MAKHEISTDMTQFRKILNAAKRIVVISGAGISAESGVPTFRGAGGYWRKYVSQDLATPKAFQKSPSLVWEFYHYRRELVNTKQPNKAHLALVDLEKRLEVGVRDRRLTIITQNVDGLHTAAGSKRVIELHGSLYKTQCTKCGHVEENRDSPICEALRGRGEPNLTKDHEELPVILLPQCKQPGCHGLLRPYVVWFGESLHDDVLKQTRHVIAECDLCLVVGTSSVVYPAAMFSQELAYDGVPVAEFNLEETEATSNFKKHDLRTPRPSNNIDEFRKLVKNASHIVVITGAGISADSGVPTYEGSWGTWRGFPSHMLDCQIMFSQQPEIVWEFNQFRRDCVLRAKPNMAHIALAKHEKFLIAEGKGRTLTVITQNIDELHTKAGSKNVIEMHGSLFRTKCVSCGHIEVNMKNPICPVLKGRGSPLPAPYPKINVKDLPHCSQPNCTGLLRPHIVWYREPLLKDSIQKAEIAVKTADLGLLVGTSSKVMPVAFYAPSMANRGVHVAEFNLEPVATAGSVTYYFEGSCADTLPEVFKD